MYIKRDIILSVGDLFKKMDKNNWCFNPFSLPVSKNKKSILSHIQIPAKHKIVFFVIGGMVLYWFSVNSNAYNTLMANGFLSSLKIKYCNTCC